MRFDRDLPRWLVPGVLGAFAVSQLLTERYAVALALAVLAAVSVRAALAPVALVAAAVTAGAAGVWWQVGADAVLLAAILVAPRRHALYEAVDRS